ncbi:hypothetical protein [Mammaliicoccus lentus]|uniref:hypothetical protein n=1 Tax=Mammaliicoccus lentus TaxID=42858 RepID=UPI002DB61391|nr:hypothetical protein [Mammaliicoccus lentus]MEB8091863.1 hypothetical protein [Mammaliicoccus lentus]
MEISLLAILLSIAALGLNVMLIAFWSENKKQISSVSRHLENEIKWMKKDNEQRYVKNVHYENAIRDIKIDEREIVSKISDLEERIYKYEETHSIDEEKVSSKLKKYRVTFEVKRMYNGTIPIMYHPQYEVECRAGDMDSVVEFAQNAFDSHPDNVELKREIVKIEVLGR